MNSSQHTTSHHQDKTNEAPPIIASKVNFWLAFTSFALLLCVILTIAMIVSSQSLVGLESFMIIISTLPLMLALLKVRQLKRNGIVIGLLVSMLYFCVAVVAIFSEFAYTWLALLYAVVIVAWFTGGWYLVRRRFPQPPRKKSSKAKQSKRGAD